jgi:acylphosphatase
MAVLKEGSLLSTVEDIQYEIIDDAVFNTDGFEIRY